MRIDDRPVLVLGATGTTGSRVAAALRERGFVVRAASRRGAGADGVRFDWDDPGTHEAALAGARGIYLVPPPGADPAAPALPFLHRAAALGVERVVLLSSSALEPGGPMAGAIHAALPDTGFGWAVLRPSWFMQNLWNPAHHLGAALARGEDLVTATGHGRVGLVDAADIAAVAATLLTAGAAPDRDLVLTGPEALDYDTVAARLSRVLGRTVRHRAVTPAESAAAMVAAGVDPVLAETLAGLEAAIAGGAEDRTTAAVRDVTGHAPRDLLTAYGADGPLAALPPVYRRHLEAVTGPEPATVREVWEPDGVLEFPYAPAGSPYRRLEGADAIVAYFDGLRTFRDWSWSAVRAARVEGADEHVAELHGSATLLAGGAPYEQDYVVRFGVGPSGRLAWMREYWDVTRLG